MKPRPNSHNIVILGFWNRMIFGPQWVINELFHNDVEKLVSMDPVAPLIYRDNELVLQVAEDKIVIQLREPSPSSLERAEKLATDTLEALPKTPVSAIGVNFGFLESDPREELLKLFDFPDDVDIASLGWDIGTKKILRQLTKDKMTLNLTMAQESPSTIRIDANYHFPVESPNDAIKKINGHIPEMHDALMKLINEVYALYEEETDE